MASPIARVREHLKEPLHRASWAAMFSTILMAGVGALFWALATHIYDKEDVGRGNAIIFAMMLLASVFQMNMSNAVVRFLPQEKEHLGRRIAQAYAIAAVCSGIAALIFAYVAAAVSPEYEFFTETAWLPPVFALSTAMWAIFVVQDPVLMALGRAMWMPPENFAHSAGKLLLLPLMYLMIPDWGLLIAWVVPLVAIIPVINFMIARIAVPSATAAQQGSSGGAVDAFGHSRSLMNFMFQDFLGSAATQTAIYATPLITLALLGPAANAVYSMPFAAMTGLDLLFVAVLTTFTAEASRSPERIAELTRLVVRRLTRVQLPASLLVFVAAPLLMLPFDPSYREAGTEVARIIALAGVFRALMLFYETVVRLQGNGRRLLFVQALNMVLVVGLCFVLAEPWGINGIAASWFFAAVITALVTTPWLVAFLRRPEVRVA